MKTFYLMLFLLSPLANAADSMGFECRLIYPPQEQGADRFVKVDFSSQGRSEIRIADLTSPFEQVSQGLKNRVSVYSHKESSAGASWVDESGAEVLSVSLAYFGSWWGAIVDFKQDVITSSLRFPKGTNIELRCSERPSDF